MEMMNYTEINMDDIIEPVEEDNVIPNEEENVLTKEDKNNVAPKEDDVIIDVSSEHTTSRFFIFQDVWLLLKIMQIFGLFPYKKITDENGVIHLTLKRPGGGGIKTTSV